MAWKTQKKLRKKPDPLGEEALYQFAVVSLGRRMRTVAELKRLMRAKVEPEEPGERKIEAVLARLREYGYIDDAAFAAVYTRLRQENDGLGKLRVQRDLVRKGVARELVERTLDQAYRDTSEEAAARSYLARKRVQKPQSQREVARVIRRLSTAGFSFAVISKILKTWDVELSEDDFPPSDPGGTG
jgi:regulatory protein